MRILILSDVHSNYSALEAVLNEAGSFDQLWCLGDTIGYGPAPNECVAVIAHRATFALSGNHDMACLGKVDLNDFNPDARRANIWNGQQLSEPNRKWLEALPPAKQINERFTAAHGSPREPIWEYLLTVDQAQANFQYFEHQACFIGHSHIQLGFRREALGGRCQRFIAEPDSVVDINTSDRFFLNPGSVGQPRDQDPRAAYAIYDTEALTIHFHRTEYDIFRTQRHMREAGLPLALIRRLEYGM